MNREELRNLWGRYIVGEFLTDPDRDALQQGLECDPELREELLDDIDVHGLLRSSARDNEGAERFVLSIADYLSKDRHGTRFITKLRSRLIEDRGPDPTAAGGARLRTRTPRRGTRASFGPSGSSPQGRWLLAALAAGILLGLLMLATFTTRPVPPGKPDVHAGNSSIRKPAPEREPVDAPPAGSSQDSPRVVPRPPVAATPEESEQKRNERIARELRVPKEATRPPESTEVPDRERSAPSRPPEKGQSRVEVARLERVEGEVRIHRNSEMQRARSGQPLLEGDGLETLGPKSSALAVYPDRTVWEAGPETLTRGISELGAAVKDGRGKSLEVVRGSVTAQVVPQPLEQPFRFLTPQAEARVLGTTLRITVNPDPKTGSTRLEVAEGKVRLIRVDTKFVDVASGHVAVAGPGIDLVSMAVPSRAQQEGALAKRLGLILFEDFEQDAWKRHWSSPSESSRTTENRLFTFLGRRALEVKPKVEGWHRLTIPTGYPRVHMRMVVHFPREFAFQEGMTLFQLGALPNGPKAEEGLSLWMDRTPNGRDFFKAAFGISGRGAPRFYYYHPDQADPKGDGRECDPTGASIITPGTWHCVELMVQANDPGKKNGVLRAWLDGAMCGELQGIRFRDVDSLQVREMGLVGVPSGDQSYYIDDVVIARDYIGPVLGEFQAPSLPKK